MRRDTSCKLAHGEDTSDDGHGEDTSDDGHGEDTSDDEKTVIKRRRRQVTQQNYFTCGELHVLVLNKNYQ